MAEPKSGQAHEPPLLLRAQDAPRWLLLLLVLLLVAPVAGLFAWLQATGRVESVIGQAATLGHEPVVTQLSQVLDEHFSRALHGRVVALEVEAVQQVVGDYTFWIGPNEDRRVPVVLLGEAKQRQPERVTSVDAGDRVRVYGMIRTIDELSAFDEDHLLQSPHRTALQQHEMFISALRVDVME